MAGTSYPLTSLDTIHADTSITAGYILSKSYSRPYDTTRLQDAIERVAEKWPFLAARVVRDKTSGLYHIHVPSERLGQHAVQFTVTTHYTYLRYHSKKTPIPSISSERVPSKYFRHPSTPTRLSAYAATSHPLLSVHVAHMKDATCIGFTSPRGVFDTEGLCQLLCAINHELSGRDWKPPFLPDRNVFADVLTSLPSTDGHVDAVEHFKREWSRRTIWTGFKSWTGSVVDQCWRRPSTRSVYLDATTVELMVNEAKDEAKASEQCITTGDVILAWFTKAALSEQVEHSKTVSIHSSISFRDVLADGEPSMRTYPHNATLSCPMRRLTHSQLASLSIAELAMEHASHVETVQTPSSLGALSSYLGPPTRTPSFVPKTGKNTTTMMNVSDQAGCDVSSMHFGPGSKVVGFEVWHHGKGERENSIWIGQFRGGIFVGAKLREGRWRAVGRELEKLW